MKLHEALDTFSEHIDDVLDAMSSNLLEDVEQERRDAQILGTGWVADEVRTIRHHNLFDERIRRIKRIALYKKFLLTPRSQNRITDADIARAKQHPIQDLYSGKLQKQGIKLWGHCPFHTEDTPSFVVDTKRNNWHCFGVCGVGGDSIAFYAKMHNLDMRKDFVKIIKSL